MVMSFCSPSVLPVEPFLEELALFANASVRVRTSTDAAWQLEQQSGKLKGSPCSNDQQAKLMALTAQNSLGNVVVCDQTVFLKETLSSLAGHCEA